MVRRPRLFSIVLTAAGLAFFLKLGFWQLGRAEYKQALLEAQALAEAQPEAELSVLLRDPEALEGRRARGRVVPLDRSVLLDNQIRERETGVEVFTPARIEGDPALLLLARGWRPVDRRTRAMPEVPIPERPLEVSGRVARAPSPGFAIGRNDAAGQGWPKVLARLDFAELEALYGQPVHRRVLWLDPGPYSWPQRFEPVTLPPERHRGYALQWFALAAAVVVVFVVLHLRRPGSSP